MNNYINRYGRSTFVFDFISVFVLGLNMNQDNFVQNVDNNIFIYIQNSLVLLKIVSFQAKIKHLEQSIPMKEKWRHILALVGLLASIIIVAHFVAILWNAIGQYEDNIGIQNNWQAKLGIQHAAWEVRYIYSLYWSVTTMCTVGYGDITPLNAWEVAFVTVNIIFVSTVFAYSINSIGIILSDIAKISKQYKEDLSIMNRFLSRKQVNIDLQFRVKKYLEFLAEEEKEVNKKAEDAVIDKLSSHLKEQIAIEVNTKILRKYPLFSKNFSEKTLQKLVFIMKEVVVTPNELIIQEGDQDDCSLYLISKGEVEVYSLCDPLYQNQTQNKKVLAQLGKDQSFGELSFFTGQKRTANVRSLSLTSMYKIPSALFINVLKSSYEQDFEKFCMLRDEINQGFLDNIQISCFSCHELGHTALECPQITYDADRTIRLFRMNYPYIQEEKQQLRKKRQKIKALQLFQTGANQKARQSLQAVCEGYLKRISKVNLEERLSIRGLKYQSIPELDNDDESKDDSQDYTFEEWDPNQQDKLQSQNMFQDEDEVRKQNEKLNEELLKKEKSIQSEFLNDKSISYFSSFTNSSPQLCSDFSKMKPSHKDMYRMRRSSRFQNKNIENTQPNKTLCKLNQDEIVIL